MTPETCPNCGADVPRNARACPECGACEKTGWSESAETDGLEIPDESFDYDDFVKREFEQGGEPKGSPSKIKRLLVALIALVMVLILLSQFF